MVYKKLLIKESTRQRCVILSDKEVDFAEYMPISLELYHYFYELFDIDFPVYVYFDSELIEFMKPNELSEDLLKAMWNAVTRPETDIDIFIKVADKHKYIAALDSVRQDKVANLIANNPELDEKTLNVFSNLSSASQMVVKGGIDQDLVVQAEKSVDFMMRNLMRSEVAVGTLSRMILIDPTLYDHSAAVAMLSGIIASRFLPRPLSPKEAQLVSLCGLFHDVGKQCIPSSILNKPGSFTREEYKIMQQHTLFGFDELKTALESGVSLDKLILRTAVEHHERFNGGGYPFKKKGRLEEDPENGIHLYSRIVAIADAYSALLMKRVYKPALDADTAVREMARNAPQNFDMDIFVPFVEAVCRSIKFYDHSYQPYSIKSDKRLRSLSSVAQTGNVIVYRNK